MILCKSRLSTLESFMADGVQKTSNVILDVDIFLTITLLTVQHTLPPPRESNLMELLPNSITNNR